MRGGVAGEYRNLIILVRLLRCFKDLNHPAPPLLFSPSTLLILPHQFGPLASPPPTPHPPPPFHPELIRNQQQTVRCIKGRDTQHNKPDMNLITPSFAKNVGLASLLTHIYGRRRGCGCLVDSAPDCCTIVPVRFPSPGTPPPLPPPLGKLLQEAQCR